MRAIPGSAIAAFIYGKGLFVRIGRIGVGDAGTIGAASIDVHFCSFLENNPGSHSCCLYPPFIPEESFQSPAATPGNVVGHTRDNHAGNSWHAKKLLSSDCVVKWNRYGVPVFTFRR